LASIERLVSHLSRQRTSLPEELTERELRLLPSDLSQREIGRERYRSLYTIRTRTRSIYAKLDVASRTAAVERARARARNT